jgi:hypothetical protein
VAGFCTAEGFDAGGVDMRDLNQILTQSNIQLTPFLIHVRMPE